MVLCRDKARKVDHSWVMKSAVKMFAAFSRFRKCRMVG